MKYITICLIFLIFAASTLGQSICTTHYTDLKPILINMGWVITSTTKGKHNLNSRHYLGKAIDISVRNKTEFDIMMLYIVLEGQGYQVLDERVRPKGQKVWHGPHIHVQVPDCK